MLLIANLTSLHIIQLPFKKNKKLCLLSYVSPYIILHNSPFRVGSVLTVYLILHLFLYLWTSPFSWSSLIDKWIIGSGHPQIHMPKPRKRSKGRWKKPSEFLFRNANRNNLLVFACYTIPWTRDFIRIIPVIHRPFRVFSNSLLEWHKCKALIIQRTHKSMKIANTKNEQN